MTTPILEDVLESLKNEIKDAVLKSGHYESLSGELHLSDVIESACDGKIAERGVQELLLDDSSATLWALFNTELDSMALDVAKKELARTAEELLEGTRHVAPVRRLRA